jgi:hypothetical protein
MPLGAIPLLLHENSALFAPQLNSVGFDLNGILVPGNIPVEQSTKLFSKSILFWPEFFRFVLESFKAPQVPHQHLFPPSSSKIISAFPPSVSCSTSLLSRTSLLSFLNSSFHSSGHAGLDCRVDVVLYVFCVCMSVYCKDSYLAMGYRSVFAA